jgi:ketosteroid isomerase-like protein
MLGQARHPKAIIALCIVMVVAIVAVAVFESSQGTFVGGGSVDPTKQVEADYSAHLVNIHSMNVSAIEADYDSNASIAFVDAYENTGNYTGLQKIAEGYQADMYTNFALPMFSYTNSTVNVSGSKATVDSSFLIQGYNTDGNALSALVKTQVTYVHKGGAWLISYELWSFTFPQTPPGG